VAIALPDDDNVDLAPPSAAEVRDLARGFLGAIAPPGGPTELQHLVVRAVCHSMTGIDVDTRRLEPLAPEDLAPRLRRRNLAFRTRIVQVMELGELILVPIPPEVTARVELVARLLGVDDGMLGVAKDYSRGSLGLALVDFERNGYTADWDAERSAHLHTRDALQEAWDLCVDDPDLAGRWAELASCPPGSLGRALSTFYQARGFVYPGLAGSAPPYLAQHDWVHVVADYGTTVESEIEVFGLIARAIPDPRGFSLLAMVIGLFETGYVRRGAGLFESDRGHLSKAGMAERLGDAMRRGACCGQDLMDVDWFELAERPVGEVRDRLGIVPKAPEAVAAGSVGPWERGGISPFQIQAGRAFALAAGREYDPAGARPA
jgi:hypothetical protein